jgi:hypothetical protein
MWSIWESTVCSSPWPPSLNNWDPSKLKVAKKLFKAIFDLFSPENSKFIAEFIANF